MSSAVPKVELRKELGLADLVLTQIVYVVGPSWVGAAAKLGESALAFWLLAITFFYVPLAAVVIYLNRLMPLEGGLYQWAKLGFNNFVGFMTAWNLWLYSIFLVSVIGLVVTSNLSYALGPSAAWTAESKWFITLASCAVIGALMTVTILGLGIGKWVHNIGGVLLLATYAVLVTLPFLNHVRGGLREYQPLAMALPTLSLFSLNIFGKMAMGALSGFEYVAILAGECRHPARTIGRSVIIAAPIIALMFMLGTSSVRALVPAGNIDLISPIPQTLTVGFSSFVQVAPLAILLLLGRQLASASFAFAGNSRLPMVAGWDHLLPDWFSKLHPRRKTPVHSILFVGAITLALAMASLVGVGHQEAYQLLDNAAGIFYAIAYLILFAIPLLGLRGAKRRTPVWLQVAASSGFLMTLLYTVLSIFPIIDVKSWFTFAAKICSVIVCANLIGAGIFWIEKRNTAPEGGKALAVAN